MNLNPMLCGRWDGVSIWLQWANAGAEYHVQVRYQQGPNSEWTPWNDVVLPQGRRSYWGVLPTWKEGWLVQARVSVDGSQWEIAREVEFQKCRCLFEISTEKKLLRMDIGTTINAIVDNAACSYVSEELIELEAGQTRQSWFTAITASGYCQLDKTGDFIIHPLYGVTIRNLGESIEDVTETGREYSQILSAPVTGAMSLAANLQS